MWRNLAGGRVDLAHGSGTQAMDNEGCEMGDARETGEAGESDAKAGAEEEQSSLGATTRRVREAAGVDREQETPAPPTSGGEAEPVARGTDDAWDTVIARIAAMEAGEAAALRGRDIRALRKAVRMSARELAKRLGYTESAIYDWETERHFCPTNQYLSLLDAIRAWREEQEQWMALIHKDLWAQRKREP